MTTPKIDIVTSKDKFLIPVFKLTNSPVVLAPGILYKINFNNDEGFRILNYFKKNSSKINNHLLETSFPKAEAVKETEAGEKSGVISDDSIRSSRALKKFLNGEKQSSNKTYDWLLCGLLAKNEKEYVTVVRIVGVTYDESNKGFVLTFQALTRGKISSEETGFPKDCLTEVVSNIAAFKDPVLKELVYEFNDRTSVLFEKIEKFLKMTSVTEGTKPASLSPLYQILYLQLNNSDYVDSITKLKSLISKFNTNYEYEDTAKNSEIYLKLLDLTIAILPISNLEFLKALDISERVHKFHSLLEDFEQIFEVLDKALNYVSKFNSNATNLEKSKIISDQLKSIRHSIDVISPDLRKLNGKNGSNEQENELGPIIKFINNIPSSLPKDAVSLLTKDFKRLVKMPTQHSEYQVLRNYFDIIVDIPFEKFRALKDFDLEEVSAQLDDDHYGLYRVKKRLLQYVSVLKLLQQNNLSQDSMNQGVQNTSAIVTAEDFVLTDQIDKATSEPKTLIATTATIPFQNQTRSPILLFVGPPGVGKTSLAKSIASSLGREFQRVSLGGVRDESEIRGHRRTYVGSMPGLIINALRKAGTMNPLILLDEIDKVCGGVNSTGKLNGDPEAALLEVLDPEQNGNFTDHYVGFPVDLSQVLFVCTANELGSISAPLRDRMEVIELSGYSFDEKREIGARFLLPKQVKSNGLPKGAIKISGEIWGKLISEYVRESGVRNLERLIGGVCRGKAVEFITDKATFQGEVKEIELIKYLGLPRFPVMRSLIETPSSSISSQHGIVNGLSYSSSGVGDVLLFEVVAIPNKSVTQTKLQMTGNLGKTLSESVQIAIGFIRSILSRSLLKDFDCSALLERLDHCELNLHVPAGGIEKDGPSAGITITLAVLSTLLEKKVPETIAMTGEISLRGKVLPIGGVLEKLLGASQYGLKTVLLPSSNERDVIEAFSENDEELMKFVLDKQTSDAIIKERIDGKLGLRVIYVETFWDVLKAVWDNQVKVEEGTWSSHI